MIQVNEDMFFNADSIRDLLCKDCKYTGMFLRINHGLKFNLQICMFCCFLFHNNDVHVSYLLSCFSLKKKIFDHTGHLKMYITKYKSCFTQLPVLKNKIPRNFEGFFFFSSLLPSPSKIQ